MRRSRALLLLCAILLLAFGLRALSLDAESLWRDEVDSLRFATAPWPEMVANFTRPGWNGPLYYLLLRGWIALAGRSEYALRYFSLFWGVSGVALIYVLGLRLFHRRSVGVFAALLTTTAPYMIWYGQEVKMYTLVPALVMAAIYALRRAVEGDGARWWAVQVVATTVAFYVHILAALLIPVQVILFLIWWPRARRQWRGALISLACLTLPYLPLLAWQAPLVFKSRDTGFHPYSLGQMALILFNGWSLGILPWGWPWATLPIGVAALGGLLDVIFSGWDDDSGEGQALRNRLALLAWLLLPLLAVAVVSMWQPLFTDRYMIWSAPAFYLLAALGLAAPLRWGWPFALPWLALILFVNGVNLWQQTVVPIKSDFRAAAAYVANYQEDAPPAPVDVEAYAFRIYLPLVAATGETEDALIVFQIPYGQYTFDYYYPEESYPWIGGQYTNNRAANGAYLTTPEQVAQAMERATAGYTHIWLVATEMAMWDERGLVQAWLESNARLVDEAHFPRVDVYRYARPDSP